MPAPQHPDRRSSGRHVHQSWALRVYVLLLHVYPRAHRREFGSQMLQTFQDQYRDHLTTPEERALAFWCDLLCDAVRSLVREYAAILRSLGRRIIDERTGAMKTESAAVLAVVAGLLVLLGLRVWLSPQLLSAPHGGSTGFSSVAGLALLLVIYALVALLVLVRSRVGDAQSARAVALRRATLVGAMIGGGVLVAIAVDTLEDLASPVRLAVWGTVVLAAPLGWALTGFLTAHAGGTWRLGVGAALWSGMVSALIGAAGEVTATLLALPSLVQQELRNPDYLAWHQSDVQSYAIASALAIGILGLLLAPLVASIVGGVACRLGTGDGARGRTAVLLD